MTSHSDIEPPREERHSELHRAGVYVKQPTGYRAFRPAPLPPEPPIRVDPEMSRLLSDADRALGRLDGVASVLPNPDLFVAMYVRHEAVLSSQIEGTQSSLDDVLEIAVDRRDPSRHPLDVEEVINYVAAMNYGLERLEEFPLSLRLVREIHGRLLENVRGAERNPGEFRRSQNWIGPSGCTLQEAVFVPPPPHEMKEALGDLEHYLHATDEMPTLFHCGLVHAQFETIHPLLDGNGRVGRLLITLLLCQRGVLQLPLLYLSLFFKKYRAEYYDRLMAIRTDGDWEGWLRFFLRGVYEVSRSATETARSILRLRESDRQRIASHSNALILLDHLYQQPIVTVRYAERVIGCSYTTAANAVRELEDRGILEEITGQKRNRRYRYSPYLRLFENPDG